MPAIYITTLDGREISRRKLFDLWFNGSQKNKKEIERSDIYEEGADYNLCASLFIHTSNPNKDIVIRAFRVLKEILIS